MKFNPDRCPHCGTEPDGTRKVVRGTALFGPRGEDGSYEYMGETEIDWDTQRMQRDDDGRVLLWCGKCVGTFPARMTEE